MLAAAPDSSLHTACGRKKLPFAGYSVVKELACLLRAADVTWPQLPILRSARIRAQAEPQNLELVLGFALVSGRRLEPCADQEDEAGRWPQPSRKCRGICNQTNVENTGLEPVTSWLQTRRSPS
jgi:hypothetical protein